MKFIFKFCGKKSLFAIFLISMVMVLLDLVGIALIFPFLNSFVAPDSVLGNRYLADIYHVLGFESAQQVVMALGLVLISLYAIKLICKTVLGFIRHRIYADITYKLTLNLFKGLLQARYALFTEQSSSEMVNVVNAQTIHGVLCLEALLVMANEVFFLIIVLAVMLIINPIVTLLAVSVFSVLGVALYFGIVKRIERYGKIHSKLNVLVYKYGFAMANSIKDIKIMQLENQYVAMFSDIWHEYSLNDSRSKTAKGIPADISEAIILSGLVVVCIFLLATDQIDKDVIPIVGVLAVSAMRLLPSFNRITGAYNQFKYFKPSLHLVEDLNEKIKINRQEVNHLILPFANSLEIEGLSFRYRDNKVLDDVSFKLGKGGSYGFVGPSGAGKSTLLDVLVGLREPAAGSFYLDGVAFDPFNSDALRNYIGYVPQNVNLIDESVAFNISFERNYDQVRMEEVVSIAKLNEFVDGLPEGLQTMLGESGARVSGGQKQRIGIARALYRNPEILIFDEATSALDNVTERELMKEINRLAGDKTLIIVAHRLSTVEQCTAIHLLSDGHLICRGTHEELLRDSVEYRNLYYKQGH